MFYLSFILLLSTVLAVFPDIESNAENNSNPIPELYQEVTPNYMKETLNYIKSALDGYVFYDILENPPYPYNDSRVDWSSLLDGIETNTNRPFYEFYHDLKKSLAALHDSNFDIVGGNVTLNISSNDTINFGEYHICLPLQLYVDYEENQEAKIYIKEYPECSKYYDETVKTFIKEHEKVALEKINGTEPFEFVQNFFNDFYSPKNNDSYFNVKISFFHDKFLSFTPFSIEQLNYLSFQFNDNKILETKYHIIKGDSSNKMPSNHLSEASNEQITWDIQTKGGEVKCRVDKENEMNVLFFNKFSSWDDEEGERLTIFKCSELFYSNDYKIVIITEKLADGDIISSYIYTQILFPKIDVKFNMAMRKSELSKALFDRYGQKKFIDAQTCLPFESWEDFLEKDPDYYGEVEHYRTKIYNPIGEKENEEFSKEREKLIRLGHLKKSTEILIFTDTVNFGPGSNFIKTIQNNGAAIVASYAGNPKLEDKNKKTLDASLDPVEYTNFEDDQIFDYLKQKGFIIYKIPFAESFESTGKNDYPMAFKVNKPDERTNIYHTYEDTYYNEFIEKAKVIFDKYKESCNPENMNLVKEDSQCNFGNETFAHGGFQCGYNGKWDFLKCKKSFCDIGYYYNKASDKCEINHCIVDEVIEINEEQEKIYTIEPNKRYKINLNTNSYTYFFKSPIDNIITYPDSKKCSKFCVVKQNIEYMYINYNKNLENQVQIVITSKKVDLYVESIMAESPKLSYILPMAGKMIYIFQLTEDNYMYIDSFDKSTRFYYTIYNEEMTPDDIININKKYFTEGLDQYLYLQAGKIYIGVFNQEFSFTKLYIYNDIPTSINLENGNMPILFLKNNSQYELDFSKNTKSFIIRLSEKTNATLVIKENNIPTNLDLNNKYFNLTNQPFKGKLYISDIDCFDEHEYKKGAFIEILYSFGKDETQVIDKEVNNELIEKNVTLIEYVKNENNKKILEILVNSNMPYKLYTYGGLSKDNYFYYSKDGQFTNYKLNYAIKLEDPLKDLQIESGEKYYIALVITKSNPNQEIKLTTKYYGHPIEELYEIIDESYAKNVLSNLTTIIENNYIFYDIVKNPPQPIENVNYSHPAFDFREEFEKISTENRRFYDFYQDIKEVLGKPRDLHFNIQGIKTPKGIKFSYMTACLPFSYYVNKKSGEDAPKVYIRYFPDCAVYFSQEVRENVQLLEKNQTALVSINGQNPFDFIQNRGTKYWGPKSPHAHFTWIKTAIHNFPLNFFPYSPEELDMVYKFENIESTLNISYHIFIPNFREMNYLLSSSVFSEEDFDEFVQDWQNKHKQEVQLPNIFDMIKEYKKNKEILLGEEEEEKSGEDDITWDFQTPEKNGIKCRVDDYNHLNVIVQGSFSIDSIKAQEVIYYCSSKFHDNNYPVVVIENNNGGGWAILSSVLSQLLLVKSVNKEYVAYKQNEALKGNYQSYPQIFYDVDTGKTFASFEDFLNGTTDNYSTPNQTILHKKTNIIDFLDVDSRVRLKNLREQFINAGKSKKPTDIIIFTDSFAYSATSIFIKYFQNIGGAITVGFNGNPTLGKELFDASQSPSPTTDCSFTQEFKNLKELGIEVNGITFGETFDDDYKLKDPIPREYKFDPVDEMSEIYEPYTDENYQAFMDEAKKIFGKYANGSCNPNNTLLLLWNDSCTFENDTVAHGGNPCGADGAWDLNTCKKSYCDVGYYYSKTEDKCLIDYATNPPNTTEIILNDIYNGTITIDDNSEYIIRLETNKFVYFFEASEPGYMLYEINNPCPSYLCVLQMNSGNHNNKIYLNYFRNATNKQISFNITSVPNFPGSLQSLVLKDLKIERIIPNPTKIITIIESIEEYIYYFKVFDDTSKMFCAEYSKEMSIMDIVEVNSSYFREFKNQLIKPESGKIYIFVAITESPRSLLQMFMEPKTGIKDLTISDEDGPLVMYFSSGIEYTVDFINNKYDRMIQLSKSTLNSKIEIKNSESGNIVTLDSKNSYYSFDTKIFKGKLTISVKEGDEALIEFLFAPNDYEIIDNKNLINYRLTKPLIIKFDKNSKDKEVSFLLSCESTKIGYSFITYYSKNNYTYYPRDIKPTISGSNAYRFNIYNKKEELEEGESFSVVIYIDRTLLANNVILFSKIDSSISQFPELFQEVTPDYMKDVVKNIKSLLNSFVFLDILKNPPSPYNDSKVDLLEAFDNIVTNEKRPFYEFYRDIKTTIGKSRDGSLEILGGEVPLDYEKINFEEYVICLPFKLYLDYNETKKVKMYMKEFPECSKYYDESVRMTIRQNLNKSVEKINGTDSFEFIANYAKELYNMKNPESQFNNIIEFFHYNNLIYTPLLPEQISYINLTFNDNECLETYFHIEKESILNNSNKVSNGSEEIPWNFQSENGEVKCRFDEANQLNVLLINGLVLDETEEGPTLFKCFQLIYSNKNKLLIITRQLWEGGNIESYTYTQLLFPNINVKFNMAMKQTEYNKRLFEQNKKEFTDAKTCSIFESWEDFLEKDPDKYGEINHYRTKLYNPMPLESIKFFKEQRKILIEFGLNKKSTDILILTDTVNFGPASNFIKTILNNGGAIVASYAGNPKLKEEDKKVLDAGVDPAFTTTYEDTEEYRNLKEKGFTIYNIPYAEYFEKIERNDYPMAFKVNKVDERTKIYHTYEDIYYDEFIEEAKEIFDKYNNKSECNSENMNLVLEDENCTFEDGDIYAHGGYPCGNDGKWNKTKCKKSYCDIGYYYDRNEDKCLIDYCTNDPDTIEITLNGKYDKTIIINKENNTKYILKIDTEEYLYFFQSNESGFMYYELDNACPSLVCVLQKDVPNHNNKIILNPLKEVGDKEITIKITSIKNFKGYILSTISQVQMIQQNPEKLILISEPNSDYIYYFRAFDNSTKILFKEYDEDMKVNDLIEAKDFTGYNLSQFDEKSKGKIYIFMAKTEIPGTLLQILVQEKTGNRKVTIPNKNDPYVLYFSKDNEYSLDFKDNQNDIMLQLSKSTLDSEITITNEASQKTETLSSKHSYYSFDKTNANFKDKLTVKVNKGNGAAIELLYKADNFEILGEKEYNKTRIDKSAIIKLEKNSKDKNINITLESESGNKFGFSFITTYIKDDYISSTNVIEPSITGESSYKLVINNKKETLEEGESFAIILYINKDTSILVTKVEEKGEQKGEGDEDGEGLEGWIIAIIVIAVVIVVIVIAILIWKFVIGKDHVDSDAIGSLVDHNAPSNANELNEQN